jgi:ubiquinone/menaquinone biosynthesis C-methylase UbiE
MKTHEELVEQFYSHGTKNRKSQDGGFLSLGYWQARNDTYHHAVETLIGHILDAEKPVLDCTVLNVACGYGAETMEIYKKLQPNKIIAIDITAPHIDYAKTRVEKSELANKIVFEKMDAVKLPFKPLSFNYVIGIEGPAHFNTRKQFLQKAYSVLKDNGVLLLADIIVNKEQMNQGFFQKIVGKSCAKHWYMPEENWVSTNEMLNTLKKIGFTVDNCEEAGGKVYPGFAKFNLRWSSIYNAIRIRGILNGAGLTIISWMLGYLYKRKMIEYVFIRATKSI